MTERGITFFFSLTIALSDIYCLSAFLQVKNVPKFIGNWEGFIEKSEF